LHSLLSHLKMHVFEGFEPYFVILNIIFDVLNVFNKGIIVFIILIKIMEELTSFCCEIYTNRHNPVKVRESIQGGCISECQEFRNILFVIFCKRSKAYLHRFWELLKTKYDILGSLWDGIQDCTFIWCPIYHLGSLWDGIQDCTFTWCAIYIFHFVFLFLIIRKKVGFINQKNLYERWLY
jgi:hypothetical protein